MRRIEEQWKDLEAKILDPINASPLQRRETKRAFYCGCISMFLIMTGPIGALPELEAMRAMTELNNELKEFYATIGSTTEGT